MRWLSIAEIIALCSDEKVTHILIRLKSQELKAIYLPIERTVCCERLRTLPADDHLCAEVNPDGTQVCLEGW